LAKAEAGAAALLRQRDAALLSGIPRLIFLVAPLAFLLLHAYIIYAPALMIALFVLPHMIPRQPDQLEDSGQISPLFGAKSTKRCWPGISRRRLCRAD
jgi:cellulose synthase (UDP-forming)